MQKIISRWTLLILLLIGLSLAIYFNWYQYLNFETLKKNHIALRHWASHHYLGAVSAYISIYIATIALSFPGAIFLTLAGGFLFGLIAVVYVIIAATIGSSIIFLAVQNAFEPWIASKVTGWVAKMQQGFKRNAFSYLLFLRLVPIFPFWVVNIVAAILLVPLRVFVLATFLGIIPGTLVYVLLGNGLRKVIIQEQTPNLNLIFSPHILLPLLAIAILALLPVFYQKWFGE